MVALILRIQLAISICMSLVALTLPMRAMAAPAAEPQMKCCQHEAPDQHGQNHCSHQPMKSDGQQCCAGCVIAHALFVARPTAFVFTSERGEKLIAGIAAQSSRFEHPPVPPPRTAAA